MNFWKKLKKPIMCLAPMADVTDAAFRRIIAKYGKPDVIWTEFVSVDGLCSIGREKLLPDLWYTDAERPIVAQIFGCNPENFYKTALLIQELGFDGIDINMGCPMKNIEHQHAGATLMKDPQLAVKIVQETKRGAGKLPVSVKTRLGYNKVMIDEWILPLLAAEPAALTIHARTRKEMSKVPAHWDILGDVVQKIHAQYTTGRNRPIIIGNGDVKDMDDAYDKVKQYGVDGVMLGRAIFGNPWLFLRGGRGISSGPRPESARCGRDTPPAHRASTKVLPERDKPTQSFVQDSYQNLEEKLRVMLEHTRVFDQLFAGIKNFDIMKKHYKAYVSGFDGAKELRVQLMACKSVQEIVDIIHKEFSSL